MSEQPTKPPRTTSLPTLLMTRFTILMIALTLLLALIFYQFIGPGIVEDMQGFLRDALQQGNVSEAQVEQILDGSQERYFGTIRTNVRRSVLLATGVFFVVGLGAIFLITRQATRRIVTLTDAARAIARGEYQQDLSSIYDARPYTEINELARAIEESGRVHIREQVLIAKVKELEIKIDETKRQEQLDELTGSEFFQDLQSKAKKIREAKANPDES